MSRETPIDLTRSLRRYAVPALLSLVLGLGVSCSAEPEPERTTSTSAAKPSAPAAKPAPPEAPQAPAAPEAPAVPQQPVDPKVLADEGRQYYLSSCIACHNANPSKDGALGPPIAGSSYELIEARVMRAEYPAGYTPKRETRVMLAMPFLEKQLPALAAYLE